MADPTPRIAIEEAASRSKMPGSCFRVLMTLLRIRGRNADTWASVRYVADKSALSERTVQLAIAALTSAGWIVRTPKSRHETWRTSLRIGEPIDAVRPPSWRRKIDPVEVQHLHPEGCNIEHLRGATSGSLEVQQVAPESLREPFNMNPSDPLSPEKGTSVDARATPRRESESEPKQELPMPEEPRLTPLPPKLYHFDPEPPQRNNLTTVVPLSTDRPSVPPHRVKRPLVGDEVELPGDLLECLADLGPQAIPMYRRCEALGITTTAALLAIPETRLRYQRGIGEHRAQVLRLYFAEMGVLFAEEQDSKQIVASLTEHAQAVKEREQAPRGLRLIRGGGA